MMSMGSDIPMLFATFHLLIREPHESYAWEPGQAYKNYAKVLQILQHQAVEQNNEERMGKRWTLKCPVHLGLLQVSERSGGGGGLRKTSFRVTTKLTLYYSTQSQFVFAPSSLGAVLGGGLRRRHGRLDAQGTGAGCWKFGELHKGDAGHARGERDHHAG